MKELEISLPPELRSHISCQAVRHGINIETNLLMTENNKLTIYTQGQNTTSQKLMGRGVQVNEALSEKKINKLLAQAGMPKIYARGWFKQHTALRVLAINDHLIALPFSYVMFFVQLGFPGALNYFCRPSLVLIIRWVLLKQ